LFFKDSFGNHLVGLYSYLPASAYFYTGKRRRLRSLSAAFFFFYSQALANFNGWIHLSFAMKDEAFHFLNRAHVFFSLFKRWIGGRGDWLVSAVANTKMVLYNSISGELRVVFGELDPDQTL